MQAEAEVWLDVEKASKYGRRSSKYATFCWFEKYICHFPSKYLELSGVVWVSEVYLSSRMGPILALGEGFSHDKLAEKFARSLQQDRSWTDPFQPEYLMARSQLAERGPLGFGPISFFDGKFSLAGLHHISKKNTKRTNIKSTQRKKKLEKKHILKQPIGDLHGNPMGVIGFLFGGGFRSPDGSTGRFFHFSVWLRLKDLLSGFSLFLTVTNGSSEQWSKNTSVCVYIYIYISDTMSENMCVIFV